MFDTVFPIRTKKIKAQAVGQRINLAREASFQSSPLNWIHDAFENGKLHPLPKALAQPGYTPQPALTSFILSANVVSYDYKHQSPPEKCCIAVQITTQMPRQEQCLNVG